MTPNSPENPCTVTSHDFSNMVKLLFLKGFRWAFRGPRGRRQRGVRTLVYSSGLSPQQWCWCGFGLLAECGLMRGGLEQRLDSCSALMSQVRGCGPQTATLLCGCLMTPAVPAEMAPLRQSSFAPCGEISKQHLFVTPGSPLDQCS